MRTTIATLVVAAVVAVAGARAAFAEIKRPAGVFVTLSEVTDEAERTSHDVIRKRLVDCAQLANKVIDVNVTRLSYVTVGNTIELQLELGLVMSTPNNEIVSIASQTAKLVLSATKFKLAKLPGLRRELIDSALGELVLKLRRAVARNV